MSRLTVYGGGAAAAPVYPATVAVGNWGDTNVLGANQNTLALTAGTLYLSPLWIAAALTIDQCRVSVVTAVAAAHLETGIYTVNAAQTTATLLSDLGAVDASTTGVKNYTGLALTLPAGAWLAVLTDQAITVSAGASPPFSSSGSPNIQGDSARFQVTQAYGALPATVSLTGGVFASLLIPTVWYHRSA